MAESSKSNISPQTESIGISDRKKVKVRIENLSLSFGGVKALTDVSIDIKEHEILLNISELLQCTIQSAG